MFNRSKTQGTPLGGSLLTPSSLDGSPWAGLCLAFLGGGVQA